MSERDRHKAKRAKRGPKAKCEKKKKTMRGEGTNVCGSSGKGAKVGPEGWRGDLVDGPVQRQSTSEDRDEN